MAFRIKNPLRRFRDDETGTMSIETVVIVPLLFWAICATYTYFHAFKVQNAANRANYTISDIISRETGSVNADYIDGLHNLYEYMTRNNDGQTWIRVSVVRCKKKCDKPTRVLKLNWSYATGGASKYQKSEINLLAPQIPNLPKGDTLIVVETSSMFEPLFQGMVPNFGDRTIVSHSVTRPRFTQQVVWDNS